MAETIKRLKDMEVVDRDVLVLGKLIESRKSLIETITTREVDESYFKRIIIGTIDDGKKRDAEGKLLETQTQLRNLTETLAVVEARIKELKK